MKPKGHYDLLPLSEDSDSSPEQTFLEQEQDESEVEEEKKGFSITKTTSSLLKQVSTSVVQLPRYPPLSLSLSLSLSPPPAVHDSYLCMSNFLLIQILFFLTESERFRPSRKKQK